MILENVFVQRKRRYHGWSEEDLDEAPVTVPRIIRSLLAAQATPIQSGLKLKTAPSIAGVIGQVQSFTGSSLDVQTPSGVIHVDVKQPLTTYKQVPSDLTHVTSASYVGVASTEQADGKEVAKQIIIFPAEVSGGLPSSYVHSNTVWVFPRRALLSLLRQASCLGAMWISHC